MGRALRRGLLSQNQHAQPLAVDEREFTGVQGELMTAASLLRAEPAVGSTLEMSSSR